MDCDDDDLTLSKTYDDSHPIVKEAVTVYNQLKILYSSLKSNNDVDSGIIILLFIIYLYIYIYLFNHIYIYQMP